MLPGRKYTPEDLVGILRRRFWLVLVPFAAVSAATALFARSLPDLYEARAIISVVPQQVPASIVPTTVTTRLSDRIQAIQDRVLSRPRLEKLIVDLNLYPDARRTGIMQDVVDQMKTRDLRIAPNGPVAFRVSYFGREPVSTMRVAQEVASAFINESLSDRQDLANQTNAFLESATEAARLQLVEREQKVAAYRLQHSGELPTQVEANLRQMGNISTQLQSNALAMNTARQRQIQFERELLTAEETPATDMAVPPAMTGARGAASPASSTTQSLIDARRQLDAVSTKYSAIHPDVQRWTDVVKNLEAKAAAEATEGGNGLPPGVTPAEALRQRHINELRSQLAEIEQQLAGYAAEEKRLRGDFALYKARVEAAPKRESELTELLRDYDEINTSYSGLRLKSEQTALAANLQQREIGEQFRLLEPATVPRRPSSPNRERITVIGMVVGLALGIALIGLLEYRDSSFKTDTQVSAVLGLPVLAVVPVMQSEAERRRTLVWRTLTHVGLGSAVAVCFAVLVYTFLR